MIGDYVNGGDVEGEVIPGPDGRPMLRISDARGFSIHEMPDGPTLPPVEELRRMREESRRYTEEHRRG